MIKKFFSTIIGHKFISIIIIVVLAVSGYFIYKTVSKGSQQTRYVLAAVQKGSLISSVSGSGQVSASNQMDVKAKVSGDVVYIGVKNGQEVKAGTLLVQLDSTDAQKAVRDAEVTLESAKLTLEKIENPTGSSDQNGSQSKKTYEDSLNTASKAFADISLILGSLDSILFDTTLNSPGINIQYYEEIAIGYDSGFSGLATRIRYSYNDARTLYSQAFSEYKSVTKDSDSASIKKAIQDTYQLTQKVSEIVKSAKDVAQLLDYKSIQDNWTLVQSALASQYLSNFTSYAATLNNYLSSLFSAAQSIISNQIDSKSQKLTVEQKENAFMDAQDTLADYYIRAPFDGIVGGIDIQKGDSISSGDTVATEITKQMVAEISLNEVDVAKVKTGQKATLTFDAIDGLSIVGEVGDIDVIGTVSQGVVTYNVKISFNTQDSRVKPGMSVSADIITEIKQDVLVISNSAIRTSGNINYVEILQDVASSTSASTNSNGITSKTLPIQQQVEIGLSNDTMTEITNGLSEDDQVIIKTISSSASQSSQSSATTKSSNGGTGNNAMMMFR